MPTTTIDTRMTSRMSMFGTLLESSYFVSPTPSPDRRPPVKLRRYWRRVLPMSNSRSLEKISKNPIVIILLQDNSVTVE